MAAPATAERTRTAAGTTPAILKEAAPELKVEGEAEAAVEAAEVLGKVVTPETDETGLVLDEDGVERVPDELE